MSTRISVRPIVGACVAVALAVGCASESMPPGDMAAIGSTTSTIAAEPDESASSALPRPVVSTTTPEPVSTTDAPVTTPTTESAAPVSTIFEPVEGPRLDWSDQGLYLHGANLPWNSWGCDFGCGSNGGVSSDESRQQIDLALTVAKAAGLDVVRWWMFPGDPTQIETDAAGLPVGINATVYQDIDAALALAEAHDIVYVFTLFSAPSALPSSWLETGQGRERLVGVLGELFAHYGDDPRIHTWQVVNEPEWEIWNGVVDESDVRELVVGVAAAVHDNSNALVSVGSARLDGLPIWIATGLDYYTAHWYDPMGDGEWCAICTDDARVRTRYGLDAPLVIGEFYAGAEVGAQERLNMLYDRGYAGAWAWSLLPDRTMDGLTIDLAAAAAFADEHADLAP